MLTLNQPLSSPREAARFAFYCQNFAYTAETAEVFALGTHTARTPRVAMRWIRARAQDIGDQADPPGPQQIRFWLCDQREHERALAALREGHAYEHMIINDGVRYVLRAEPFPVDPAPEGAPWTA